MNERMTELYAKACLDARDKHFEDKDVSAFIACMAENFAESMMIEFTETVKQTATRIAQTGFNDGLSMEEVNKQVNGALFVLEVMRERFGVE